MRKLFIDLETSALDKDQLLPIMPEFEPDARLKDESRIKESIEAKKASWLDSAALKPTTGRIIAISTAVDDNEPEFDCTPDERTMLDILNDEMKATISQGGRIYGWNLFGFDLPLFCGRAAAHGIHAFKHFMVEYRGRWSWHEAFCDPMQIWCGPYQRSDGASLKNVAYALGLGLKEGNGKDFAKLLQDDPVAARFYSLRDITLLRGVVQKMGL